MGWFDKHKPDATKTAEEQSKAEMDALLEGFSAKVEEKIAPLRDTVTKLQTDWDTIKTEATKTPPTDTRPRDENGNVRELTPEEKQRNTQQATLGVAILTNARLTEREVLDELSSDWQSLIPEIRGIFASTPVETKALPNYPQYCRNCVDLVIAREARKGGLRRRETGEFFLEDKSTTTSREDGVLSDPALTWRQETASGTRVWTPEEQLRKLGIDPKEFVERQKRDAN